MSSREIPTDERVVRLKIPRTVLKLSPEVRAEIKKPGRLDLSRLATHNYDEMHDPEGRITLLGRKKEKLHNYVVPIIAASVIGATIIQSKRKK